MARILGHLSAFTRPYTCDSKARHSTFSKSFFHSKKGVCQVESILSKKFNTSDFTICIHDGPLAGQEVPHVHVHVIPRTSGDGGGTLQALWPNAPPIGGQVDHSALAELAKQLGGI